MKINHFEDLECWQEARKLANEMYAAIRSNRNFLNDHRLRDQCTGAAISVTANIAEGFVRRSNKEFIQFLFISVSSAAELQSHLYIALDQGYISKETFCSILDQAKKTVRITSGLITYLRNNDKQNKLSKQKKS